MRGNWSLARQLRCPYFAFQATEGKQVSGFRCQQITDDGDTNSEIYIIGIINNQFPLPWREGIKGRGF